MSGELLDENKHVIQSFDHTDNIIPLSNILKAAAVNLTEQSAEVPSLGTDSRAGIRRCDT